MNMWCGRPRRLDLLYRSMMRLADRRQSLHDVAVQTVLFRSSRSLPNNIVERDNPDRAAIVVDNRHPTNLLLTHQSLDRLDGVVRVA